MTILPPGTVHVCTVCRFTLCYSCHEEGWGCVPGAGFEQERVRGIPTAAERDAHLGYEEPF